MHMIKQALYWQKMQQNQADDQVGHEVGSVEQEGVEVRGSPFRGIGGKEDDTGNKVA